MHSTGPKSRDGRARVARNAWKHGLLSQAMVAPAEDAVALAAFDQRLREDLAPVGAVEAVLVDVIVGALWRLRCVPAVEAGLFAAQRYTDARDEAITDLRRLMTGEVAGTAIVRAHFRGVATQPFAEDPVAQAALVRAVRYDDALRSPGVRQARAFADEAGTFALLMRYETTITRRVFQALHELQRLQAQRRGEAVPPPAAADVHVTLETPSTGGHDE
jgi:hypothetical protein